MGMVLIGRSTINRGWGALTARGHMSATGIGDPTPPEVKQGSGSILARGVLNPVGRAQRQGFGALHAHSSMFAEGQNSKRGSGTLHAHSQLSGRGYRQSRGSGPLQAHSQLVATGQAPSGGGSLPFGHRRVKFYLSTDFLSGFGAATQSEIANSLVQYVEDMQLIFEGTQLVLVYNPLTDVVWKTQDEVYNSVPNLQLDFPAYASDVTTHVYGIWVYKVAEGQPSTGATMYRTGVNEMSSVFNGWMKIFTQADLDSNPTYSLSSGGQTTAHEEYIFCTSTQTHEWGHGMSLGITEGYNKLMAFDETGLTPDADIIYPFSGGAGYCDARFSTRADPMTGLDGVSSLADMRANCRFCPMHRSVIDSYVTGSLVSTGLFYYSPSHHAYWDSSQTSVTINVEVLNAANDAPIQGADVSIFENQDFATIYTTTTAREVKQTNASGLTSFVWGTNPSITLAQSGNVSRLFRAAKSGFNPNKGWIMNFDYQAKKAADHGFHTQQTNDWHYFNKVTIKL